MPGTLLYRAVICCKAAPRSRRPDLPRPAFAKAPMLGTQAPYFYRFKLGNAEATDRVRRPAAARRSDAQRSSG